VALHSQGGNYGSTVYDNMEGWDPTGGSGPTFVDAHICDDCFVIKLQDDTIHAFVSKRPEVRPRTYRVRWNPKSDDNDFRDPEEDCHNCVGSGRVIHSEDEERIVVCDYCDGSGKQIDYWKKLDEEKDEDS